MTTIPHGDPADGRGILLGRVAIMSRDLDPSYSAEDLPSAPLYLRTLWVASCNKGVARRKCSTALEAL